MSDQEMYHANHPAAENAWSRNRRMWTTAAPVGIDRFEDRSLNTTTDGVPWRTTLNERISFELGRQGAESYHIGTVEKVRARLAGLSILKEREFKNLQETVAWAVAKTHRALLADTEAGQAPRGRRGRARLELPG